MLTLDVARRDVPWVGVAFYHLRLRAHEPRGRVTAIALRRVDLRERREVYMLTEDFFDTKGVERETV